MRSKTVTRSQTDTSLCESHYFEQTESQSDEQTANAASEASPRSKRIRTQVVPYDHLKLSQQQKQPPISRSSDGEM